MEREKSQDINQEFTPLEQDLPSEEITLQEGEQYDVLLQKARELIEMNPQGAEQAFNQAYREFKETDDISHMSNEEILEKYGKENANYDRIYTDRKFTYIQAGENNIVRALNEKESKKLKERSARRADKKRAELGLGSGRDMPSQEEMEKPVDF